MQFFTPARLSRASDIVNFIFPLSASSPEVVLVLRLTGRFLFYIFFFMKDI